jgi:hypothetical protein
VHALLLGATGLGECVGGPSGGVERGRELVADRRDVADPPALPTPALSIFWPGMARTDTRS